MFDHPRPDYLDVLQEANRVRAQEAYEAMNEAREACIEANWTVASQMRYGTRINLYNQAARRYAFWARAEFIPEKKHV